MAFGAGVVGLDDVVGWDVLGGGHGGEATGAQRRRREHAGAVVLCGRYASAVGRPLRVAEDLPYGLRGGGVGADVHDDELRR